MVLKKILDAIERKGVKQGKAKQEAGLARGRISKWKSNRDELGWEAARLVAWFAGW